MIRRADSSKVVRCDVLAEGHEGDFKNSFFRGLQHTHCFWNALPALSYVSRRRNRRSAETVGSKDVVSNTGSARHSSL